MKTYTKKELISKLKLISKMGWIENKRHGNVGGIGNTIEDLLEIEENNLPLPNAGEWELKTQRKNTTSLTTLFHMEPSPRAMKFVPQILLLNYGWKHNEAGLKYPKSELSFRQTISCKSRTDRGFGIEIDNNDKKILLSFDSNEVSEKHTIWLDYIKNSVGLEELNPQPYWGFNDLIHKAGTKLTNCFYVIAEVKKENSIEFYSYTDIYMCENLDIEYFVKTISDGNILIDFDARTGHNHGTKFRLKTGKLTSLYKKITKI